MISVIVPVYNAEKFLDKCVNSILEQTYRDYELILIDDGSTDNSGVICDYYSSQFEFVIAIHIPNGGPSLARNEGVKKANGDYITFVDSDDFVSFDYLETLYSTLVENNADISSLLIKRVKENEKPVLGRKPYETVLISGNEAVLNILYQKNLDTTPCGMLFKKWIVRENPFPEHKFHEDDYTVFKYYECARKVALTFCAKYFYVQHNTSIMHMCSERVLLDELDAADYMVDYFKNKNDLLYRAALSKKFSNYCQVLIKCSSLKIIGVDTYLRVTSFLNMYKMNVIKDRNTRFKNKIAAVLLFISPKILAVIGRLI